MNERVYNRVANALLLIGIASALLFDSGKVPHWVAGTVGIAAGVAAMVLYFWNQHEIAKKKAAAEIKTSVQDPVTSGVDCIVAALHTKTVASRNSRLTLDVDERTYAELNRAVRVWGMRDPNLRAIEMYRKETTRLWLSHYATYHTRALQWHVVKDASMDLMKPEVELSPNEVAACAMEIMQNLAIADKGNQWEYFFGSKGLRVKRANAMRAEVPQEEFDFNHDLEPLSRAS
jgi:hypothetical protein